MLQLRGTGWEQGVQQAVNAAPYLGLIAGMLLRAVGWPKGTVAAMTLLGLGGLFAGTAYLSRRPQRLAARARRRFLLERHGKHR